LSRNRAAKSARHQLYQVAETENVINIHKHIRAKSISLIPRTLNQEKLILALQNVDQHIVVATGPAGTGKTYLAMLAAIQALKTRQCDRIILTRPAVGVEGEQHGFLPGNLFAKMLPWTRPLLDVLREYYSQKDLLSMIEDEVIEISPLAFMRGRTFKHAWIVADEMQNSTISQMKMLLTRLGENSRLVITGDLEQFYRNNEHNGLDDFLSKFRGRRSSSISSLEFGRDDIQREAVVKEILDIYGGDIPPNYAVDEYEASDVSSGDENL
jgi:phosphate starvation-inducible PhoH-like protein